MEETATKPQKLARAIVLMAERMDESSYQAGRHLNTPPEYGQNFNRASSRQRLALMRLVNALANQ